MFAKKDQQGPDTNFPVESLLFLNALAAAVSCPPPPQLGRYTKDGQLFLGPLGSNGDDTRCVVDDQISNFPQLLNCDKVANQKQRTWHFSQVRRMQGKAQEKRSLIQPFPVAARREDLHPLVLLVFTLVLELISGILCKSIFGCVQTTG